MNTKLDTYLNDVNGVLKALPAERRSTELRELRLHLTEMMEQRQQDGESEAEAVENTLRQFGAPKAVGFGLRSSYFRGNWRDTPIGAFLIALTTYFVLYSLWAKGMGLLFQHFALINPLQSAYLSITQFVQAQELPVLTYMVNTIAMILTMALICISSYAIPAIATGLITARIAPRYAAKATLIALGYPLFSIACSIFLNQFQITGVNLSGLVVRDPSGATGDGIISYTIWPIVTAILLGVAFVSRLTSKRRQMIA